MLSSKDFTYLLSRVNREADSPTGQALAMVFMHGKLPIEAVRNTGVPMVRFGPVYDSARKIVNALTLTEADGFTAEELPVANRALAAARAKETLYLPSQTEYTALERLRSLGGKAKKAMNLTVDEIPTVTTSTLWALESHGAITAANIGGPVFEWALTPIGEHLLKERFK